MPDDYVIDPLFDEIAADLLAAQQACMGARLRLQLLNLPQYITDKDPLYVNRSIELAAAKTKAAAQAYPGQLREYKKQEGV